MIYKTNCGKQKVSVKDLKNVKAPVIRDSHSGE